MLKSLDHIQLALPAGAGHPVRWDTSLPEVHRFSPMTLSATGSN